MAYMMEQVGQQLANGGDAISSGVQLAQAAEGLVLKKKQAEALDFQISQAKVDSFIGGIKTIAQAGENYRGPIAEHLKKQAEQSGFGHFSAIYDRAAKDEGFRNSANMFLTSAAGREYMRGKTPQEQEQWIDALANSADGQAQLDTLRKAAEEEHKLRMQENIADKRIQAQAMYQNERLSQGGARIVQRANSDYAKNLAPIENTIQSSNRVLHLLGGVQSGELKSTKTLKSDLSAAMAQMFAGGKPPTVYGMSNAEFDSLYGKAQHWKDFLAGTTSDTLTTDQLVQMQKDVMSLKEAYSLQHKINYESFAEGQPDEVKNKLDARYSKFRKGALGESEDSAVVQQVPPATQPDAGNIMSSDQAKVKAWMDRFKTDEATAIKKLKQFGLIK